MNTYFLENYALNPRDGLTFPFLSSYGCRHLDKANTTASTSSAIFHATIVCM